MVCCMLIPQTIQANEKNFHAKLDFFIREIQNSERTDRKIIPLCDSVIGISLVQEDTLQACSYYNRKAECLYDNYDFFRAFDAYNQIISLTDVSSQHPQIRQLRNQALMQIVKTARLIGLFTYSVEKCYQLLTECTDPNSQIFAHALLAINLWELNNPIAALESIQTADAIARTSNIDSLMLSNYYNYKAGIHYYQHQPDSAIYCLNQAIQHLHKDVENRTLKNDYINNLAITYWGIGEYDLAKRCFQKNFTQIARHPISRIYVNLLYNYSELCYNMHEADSAAYFCRQAIASADSIQAIEVASLSRLLYSNLLYDKGLYKESRDLYANASTRLDSIHQHNLAEKLTILHNDYNNQKLEKQHKLLQQEMEILALKNKNRTILILSLFLIAILLMATTLWITKKYTKNIQSKKELQNKMKEKDSDMAQLKQTLYSEIDVKDEQLQLLAKAMTAFHNTLSTVQENLKSIYEATDMGTVKETAKNTQFIINKHKQEKIIVSFETYFDQQFNDFSKKLLEYNSSLTSGELQLCMLLAMNMPAKDIAFYLNKSVRTIESMVYRLRKKLEIPTLTKTPDFFRQFIHENRQV